MSKSPLSRIFTLQLKLGDTSPFMTDRNQSKEILKINDETSGQKEYFSH
jgi:hypothetical protein